MYRNQHKHNPVAIDLPVLLQCGMDDRLTFLETKLAYLEDMVLTLNELVVRQGKDIETLQTTKERLEARLTELAEMGSDIPSRRPPHY